MDAYVNEYHLYSSPSASHNYSTNVRAWMETENRVRVKIQRSEAARPGDPVQFSVLVAATENGQRTRLAEMSFPSGIAPPDVASISFDTRGKALAAGNSLAFSCPPEDVVSKPWRATDAKIASLSEIYSLYMEIQKAVVNNNVDRFMELSRDRIAFTAEFTGQPRSGLEAKTRRVFTAPPSGGARWKTLQNPDRELMVHEILLGKVVRILDLYGNPPLRTVADADGFQFGYDVVMAVTAGGLRWMI